MATEFFSMKIGDKVPIGKGDWNDAKREILAIAAEFAKTQDPEWQFQANRSLIGTPSPRNDEYEIERIK